MKLEDIQKLWDEDSAIDESEVGTEASVIAQKHHRYLKIYNREKLALIKFQEDLKRLKFEKTEFYRDGPTEETKAKGWEFPARGRLAPALATSHVEADKDVIEMNLRIGFQQEKIWYLHEIIKQLNNRNFALTNILNDRKWRQGD